MEYGFATIPYWSLDSVVELIRQAEELGYDQAWIPDQTFFNDPFPILAVAGQQTKRIRLGVGVTNPYTRTPIQVARAIGTVAQLAGRPVALGIGAGNRRDLLSPLGLEQVAPVTRCREMIELVRRLLIGEVVTHESASITMEAVQIMFECTQPVPIYVASRGPIMLRLAGELADAVIIGDLVSDAGLDYAISEITKGTELAGRKLDEVNLLVWVTCFITDGDHKQAQAYIRPWVAHHMAASPPSVQRALGMDEERIRAMRNSYAVGGAAAAGSYVTQEDIDNLAIVGDPERCASTVRRLVQRGIDQLVILLYSKDLAENEITLSRFANEVIPLV